MSTSSPNCPTELTGFQSWGASPEPFENHTGPFFYKKLDNNSYLSAFVPAPHHLNGGGFLHGGMLMTFADYALFVIALTHMTTQEHAVTVSCHTDFIRGLAPTTPVYADGEVTRATRSLIFVHGRIFTTHENSETILASFTGILKRVRIAQ